jgi:hypothetical protein
MLLYTYPGSRRVNIFRRNFPVSTIQKTGEIPFRIISQSIKGIEVLLRIMAKQKVKQNFIFTKQKTDKIRFESFRKTNKMLEFLTNHCETKSIAKFVSMAILRFESFRGTNKE